jgi:UDP-MurNAc hydroxylase
LVQGAIDICLLQFSGAIWYPMVYELPERAKQAFAKKKRAAQFARAARYVEIIGPRVVIPSAGPPCFLDEDLFRWNDVSNADDSIFPDQRLMVEHLERAGQAAVLMLPGSSGEFDSSGRFSVEHLQGEASVQDVFADKEAYLRTYAKEVAPRIAAEKASWVGPRTDLVSELKAWFEPLMALGPRVCDGIGASVRIETDDESVLLDFPEREVRADDGREVDFRFTIPRLLLDHLIRTRTDDWVNSLFLSLRFSAWRRGAYNDYIYTWFKCLSVPRIQYAEGFYAENGPTEGTFEVGGWQVQRRCPHMKADLTRFGTEDGETFTCSIHGWQWDLATGRCLTSEGHPLFARPLSPTAQEHAARLAGSEPRKPDQYAGGPEGS